MARGWSCRDWWPTACVTAARPPAGSWSFGCSRTRSSGVRSRIAGAAACSAPRSPDLERGGRFGLNVVQALSQRRGLERVAAGRTRGWRSSRGWCKRPQRRPAWAARDRFESASQAMGERRPPGGPHPISQEELRTAHWSSGWSGLRQSGSVTDKARRAGCAGLVGEDRTDSGHKIEGGVSGSSITRLAGAPALREVPSGAQRRP